MRGGLCYLYCSNVSNCSVIATSSPTEPMASRIMWTAVHKPNCSKSTLNATLHMSSLFRILLDRFSNAHSLTLCACIRTEVSASLVEAAAAAEVDGRGCSRTSGSTSELVKARPEPHQVSLKLPLFTFCCNPLCVRAVGSMATHNLAEAPKDET